MSLAALVALLFLGGKSDGDELVSLSAGEWAAYDECECETGGDGVGAFDCGVFGLGAALWEPLLLS